MDPRQLYAVPVKERRPSGNPVLRVLHFLTFNVVFMLAMLGCHALQIFFIIPLRLHPATLSLFNKLASWTEGLFSRTLLLITMLWAPTTFRITVDSDNDELDLKKIVQRNEHGRVVGLDLPDRMVIMANHQVYCDWSYLWSLLHFSGHSSNLIIILKDSLKWIPIVGPAMQVFRFIFMARSWEQDKKNLSQKLDKLAERVTRSLDPLALMIFPEGTLVSPLTRPPSQKYAQKMNIPDCEHTLLPRSTGLHFCLRTLSPKISDLRLVDVTIAYPGIPSKGYGQDYYTLQSIFGAGVPPPLVHMHLKSHNVKYGLPIGKTPTGTEPTAAEKEAFNAWLLKQWREKDVRLQTFLDKGSLALSELGESKLEYVDVEVAFKNHWELIGLLSSTIFGLYTSKVIIKLLWRTVFG